MTPQQIAHARSVLAELLPEGRNAPRDQMTRAKLSQELGRNRTYIGDFINARKASLGASEVPQIEAILRLPPGGLLDPGKPEPLRVPIGDEVFPELAADQQALDAAGRAARRELRPGEVIERDVRGGMGVGGFADPIVIDGQIVDGVRASWVVPVPFLHTELRAREHEVDIIPVDGDSMLPTLLPGDRVMIHRGAVAPSPDGIFAIDDGIGVSVKRLQLVRGSDPLMIRIMSDNAAHREDIVPAESVKVIGRVILKMSRL